MLASVIWHQQDAGASTTLSRLGHYALPGERSSEAEIKV
tara:strand:- start:504 stop:620 length:117 start_codon:yes stop_codon:yes gene_type:complete